MIDIEETLVMITGKISAVQRSRRLVKNTLLKLEQRTIRTFLHLVPTVNAVKVFSMLGKLLSEIFSLMMEIK